MRALLQACALACARACLLTHASAAATLMHALLTKLVTNSRPAINAVAVATATLSVCAHGVRSATDVLLIVRVRAVPHACARAVR